LPVPPKMPASFARLLRKHLTGGKLLSIAQYGIQRIFVLDIGKHGAVYHLVVELFDEGNVILCTEDYTIIQPLRPHRFRERDILAGKEYVFPPPDPSTFSSEEFRNFLAGETRDIVRALAVGAMLGGMYAEYNCSRTGTPKNLPANSVVAGVIYRELQTLLDTARDGIAPLRQKDACHPTGGERGEALAFNRALDSFFPYIPPPGEEKTLATKAASKEERIRERQAAILEKYEKRVEKLKRTVALMYESYPVLEEIIRVLDQESRKRPWQEIERIIKTAGPGSPASRIVSVDAEKAAVEVDIGERVTLFVHESLEVNIGLLFEAEKKLKRKIAGAKAAMEKPVVSRAKQSKAVPVMKKRYYHRFRWFLTSDGTLVLGGKDASQNEELVKRYMEGKDRFVHADVHGASVVIVKGATENMDEVAQFAASYSGAWRSGHFSTDVYSANPSQVSKTPESGEYVSRGSFIVRGEREYIRDVPLAVAIGVQLSPEMAVIGGPISAVSARAPVFVTLKPGTFEPNDTAKKVLRILRERLGEDEMKGLKSVLNTEHVAAFVPPGGSDIMEP
ncbi:MAG: fibronectin-binding domain-containing protein, partial [Methanoregulaceae archaeon]|nr:fibronectin-binding domain-containing protein [Methanoregulaceae archaeon]